MEKIADPSTNKHFWDLFSLLALKGAICAQLI
jgi:hypothetical protein